MLVLHSFSPHRGARRLLQKGRDVDAEKILHRIYAPRKLKSGG